jgi:two-component system, OmpR family, KDP operon response regulator KdpE
VLVVDDEPAILRFLRAGLHAQGYVVSEAAAGREAVQAAERRSTDLIVLDLGLPDMDGVDVIRRIRKAGSAVPIIVLSSRGDENSKVEALDLGADDFVTKPFSVGELLARIRAQLRRLGGTTTTTLVFDGLTIDLERRRVVQGGREVRLTPTEYALLELLASNAGKPLFTDHIIARVWRDAPGTTADTVRVHMVALRKKIEPDPSSPRYIVTEPWVGYRFIAEPV